MCYFLIKMLTLYSNINTKTIMLLNCLLHGVKVNSTIIVAFKPKTPCVN